jgi:hypothetical protein
MSSESRDIAWTLVTVMNGERRDSPIVTFDRISVNNEFVYVSLVHFHYFAAQSGCRRIPNSILGGRTIGCASLHLHLENRSHSK